MCPNASVWTVYTILVQVWKQKPCPLETLFAANSCCFLVWLSRYFVSNFNSNTALSASDVTFMKPPCIAWYFQVQIYLISRDGLELLYNDRMFLRQNTAVGTCILVLSILPNEYGRFFSQLKCILLKHMYVYNIGLGNETMVCAVCLSIFLWICDMAGLLHGAFLSWWYLSRIWSSVTDMQHCYHVTYYADDWHLACMFSLVYFFRRSGAWWAKIFFMLCSGDRAYIRS